MTIKRRRMAITKVLVKWKHQLLAWEFYYDLKKYYPHSILEGKNFVVGEVLLHLKFWNLISKFVATCNFGI